MKFSGAFINFFALLVLSIGLHAEADIHNPGYLVLESPATEATVDQTTWWAQVGIQSFQLNGSFTNPRGSTQNYSEANYSATPRIEVGIQRPWSESPDAGLSLGMSYTKQDLQTQSIQGPLNTELASFTWSLRPALINNYGRWGIGGLVELGELYLVQNSYSLKAQENRKVSFLGLGPKAEIKITSKTSLAAMMMTRQTDKADSLRFSALIFEFGVKTQW